MQKDKLTYAQKTKLIKDLENLYSWSMYYGKFNPNKESFQKVQNEITELKAKLNFN
jgi:flagellin-specific chaperone FliS